MSLVDVACEEAASLGAARVNSLHMRLGPLSGVVKEALLFSFDVAAADSAIAGARLIIEDVPLVVMCHTCNEEKTLDTIQDLRCPACGSSTPDIVSGRELQLFAMEIDDDAHAHS